MTLLVRLFEAAHRPDGDEQTTLISRASCFPSAAGASNPVPNIPWSIAADRSGLNNLVNETAVNGDRDNGALVTVQDEWEPPRYGR